MTADQKLAQVLTECIAELSSGTPDGSARARAALHQIEEIAPGEIEAMAARLQLHRLKRTTAH